MSNLLIAINISNVLCVTHITAKREFHTGKLFVLIESVQILILLIEDDLEEKWLIERGYSKREVRKQILRA